MIDKRCDPTFQLKELFSSAEIFGFRESVSIERKPDQMCLSMCIDSTSTRLDRCCSRESRHSLDPLSKITVVHVQHSHLDQRMNIGRAVHR